MRESRVTLDIDDHVKNFEMQATSAYYNLDRLADETEVRVSSSGTGIHIIGWFHSRLSDDEKDALRRTLGDDPKRTALDTLPSHNRRRAVNNVLWSEKDGASDIHEFDDIHAALDHVELTAHRQNVRSGTT